jgi:hypothetical protein
MGQATPCSSLSSSWLPHSFSGAQECTFGLRLAEQETRSVIDVIKLEQGHGTLVLHGQDGTPSLSELGFKRLVVMFVLEVG